MTCPRCHAAVADGSHFCAACGATLDAPTVAAPLSSGPTHLGGEAPTTTGPAAAAATPTSGWLTSSGSIDHGRFAPGAIIDGRYRVSGLLGRGGMGEVYRADDLRLGQTVALKFLPPSFGSDPARLSQFHNEVRTARQVSHANVCRVYDIGEVDHQIYLSMEYVDGEDLASLLRRIGRLPEDKAIEIARQICAGLAAAHERGVIHRDLKPANIMLDGSGRARIMDFSLAATGQVTDVRSGTPAYMAPEQLAGREVTAKSDIYALGLVLYELFTGRRAYDAKTLGDLIEQHHTGTVTAPTDLVKTLDRTIERAIFRCLEPDPSRRPASGLAVAAALPGGDPLAAALAAGETPSPDMVAASGGDVASLSPMAGMTWVVATVLLVLAAAGLSDRVTLLARTPLPKPADVLADRAEAIRESLGYTDAVNDRASGFTLSSNFFDWAKTHGGARTGWPWLTGARPAPIRFWYRTSADSLVPMALQGDITPGDPPLTQTGMTEVYVDALGRLQNFLAAPPEIDPAAARATTDWAPLFAAAALDPKTFTDAAPGRTPPIFADERRAWQGTLPGTDLPIRIEAAAYRGRPVYFALVGAWTLSARDSHASAGNQQESTFSIIFVLLMLIGAAILAGLNLRAGRADRRGAFRVATFMFFVMMAIWACLDHVRDIGAERTRLFVSIGLGLFVGGAMYLIYLALEPHARRTWPTILVGWSRLLAGQFRDAIVGRDVLMATSVGAAYAVLGLGFSWLPGLHPGGAPMPVFTDVTVLSGARHWLLAVVSGVNSGLQNGLITVLILVFLRDFVRRIAARAGRRGPTVDRLATGIAVVISVLVSTIGAASWPDIAYDAVSTGIQIAVILQMGLFAAAVMFTVGHWLLNIPLTLDPNRIYATDAWLTLALVVALAAAGFWLARAGEPLFGRAEEPVRAPG